nr:hypothetical protein [uncultured Pseudomonas sp.]
MSRKSTLECTKHGLRFEQFDDWREPEEEAPKVTSMAGRYGKRG